MRVARRSPGVAQYRWEVLDIDKSDKSAPLEVELILQGCNLSGWWDGREERPRQHGETLPSHQKMVFTNFDELIMYFLFIAIFSTHC